MQSDREQRRVVYIARQPILDFRLESEATGVLSRLNPDC
jgi:hypothetical protein